MPFLPVTVRVKRKAGEDPVDFLRVQDSNGKRQRRATEFVFSRQVDDSDPSNDSPADPVKQQPSGQVDDSNPSNDSPVADPVKQQPRRFHISRNGPSTPPTQSVLGVRKRTSPTMFIERKTRPKPSAEEPSSPSTPALTPEPAPLAQKRPILNARAPATSSNTISKLVLTPEPEARPQKKPGLNARTPVTSSNTTPISHSPQLAPEPHKVRLPSGLIAPWDLTDQQLVDEMQAYTLQEISNSIAEADATKPGGSPAPASLSLKKPSRFKPRVPKLRYHERHPEQFVKNGSEKEVEELMEDMDDDSEYIIDTYIRMPADIMEVDTVTEKNIGFLVLDGQSDVDQFYNVDTESDEDEDYDEEDENAEGHYTADYPDDEVDSDDEYGRNPYQYANDDAAFSDESDGGNKYPWGKKKPAWLRKLEHGSDDDDEDDDEDGDDN